MKVVLIRTDANTEIATGHMMRCMTISRELMKRQESVRFLVSDESSIYFLEENCFPYQVLHTDWKQLATEKELARMKQILIEEGTKQLPLLFVDSYYVTNKYFRQLHPYAKLAVIDDLLEEVYDVDLLINYSLNDMQSYYQKKYSKAYTRLLLGPRYTPLREQFQIPCCYQKRLTETSDMKKNLQVLVICGGGDPCNFLFPFLSYGIEKDDKKVYEFHVVLGAYNPYYERILNLAEGVSYIHIYQNVKNMAELMQRCDVAVSAAGTVLYECCATGLPTIFFCIADNQVPSIAAFSKNDTMLYAGDLRKGKDKLIEEVFNKLYQLKLSPDLRCRMSEKANALVDGYGASRIADGLQKILGDKKAGESEGRSGYGEETGDYYSQRWK